MDGKIVISIISLFIYILLIIMIYMFVEEHYKKVKAIKVKKGIEKTISSHINCIISKNEIPNDELRKIRNKLKKDEMYLDIFNKAIINLRENKKITNFLNIYLELFDYILIDKVLEIPDEQYLRLANGAYLYTYYGFRDKLVVEKFLKNVDSDSNYVRINIIRSLAKLGDLDDFIDALSIVSNRNIYINEKVIIDALSIFRGNKNELGEKLLVKFEGFNSRIQGSILTYFRNSGYIKSNEIIQALKVEESVKFNLKEIYLKRLLSDSPIKGGI